MDKNLLMFGLSDRVKVRLIVLIEDIRAHLATRIDTKLQNDFKCESLTGDSAGRVLRLACALGIINKPVYDNLVFLLRKRNQAAHNKPVDLEFGDFPQLEKMLPPDIITELRTRRDSQEGHYIAILDAIEEHIKTAT
jgi:hypothetical protein